MRKSIAASVLLVALAAAPAFADKGFSAGASVGYSNVSIEDSGVSVDFSDVGYKVFGAYMFNDNWGIEGGWTSVPCQKTWRHPLGWKSMESTCSVGSMRQ
jgi:OOP family OmpA-OmpF porin